MNLFNPLLLFIVFTLVLFGLALAATRMRNARVRFGLMQLALVLAVLGILFIIEMFSLYHYYKRWDFTQSEEYSFSSLTIELLESLEKDLEVTAFVDANITGQRRQIEKLLSVAKYYEPEKVDYRFADPVRDFTLASKYPQPVEAPVVYLEYGERMEKLPEFTEESFAQALAKLTRGAARTIYLLQGHGEHGLDPETEAAGMTYLELSKVLRGQNKSLKPLKLDDSMEALPTDCDLLLVGGPEIDPQPYELALMERYLREGGKMIVLLDNGKAPGMAEWLGKFGVVLRNDILIHPRQELALTEEGPQLQQLLSLSPQMFLREHPVTNELIEQDRPVFGIEARSVTFADELPEGLRGVILGDTAPEAWAEVDPNMDELELAEPDEGKDLLGPTPMSALVFGDFSAALSGQISSGTDIPRGDLFVMGDSDFVADYYYRRNYGVVFITNLINFLIGEEELISIPPKAKADTPAVEMTAGNWIGLLVGSFLIVPGVVIVIGIFVFFRRRSQG